MKKIFVFSFVLFTLCSKGQSDSATQAKTSFKVSVNYNSALHYFGRTDSLRSSGVFPMAEIWFGENFYINAAPVFINNSVASLDYAGTVASAGYQFKSQKWLGNIYFLKPFYEQNSGLVQSALKAQTGISITRLNDVVNLTAGGDVKFSDQPDYGLTGGHRSHFQKTNR